MTTLGWFGLLVVGCSLAALGFHRARAAGYSAGYSAGYVAGNAHAQGGRLDAYNGGYVAGWKAAHRVALDTLRTVPTSRGGKQIVKALAHTPTDEAPMPNPTPDGAA